MPILLGLRLLTPPEVGASAFDFPALARTDADIQSLARSVGLQSIANGLEYKTAHSLFAVRYERRGFAADSANVTPQGVTGPHCHLLLPDGYWCQRV